MMVPSLAIIIIIALVFFAERIVVNLAVRNRKARTWIRNHPLFHPNGISLIRMPAGVAGVGIWLADFPEAAIVWFAFWMITDLTDGTVARHCDLVTERGKWLDPLSDKCLYLPFLFLFAFTGPLSLPWVVLLTVADMGGQLSRLFTGKTAANQFGKAKTALITILLAVTALTNLAGAETLHVPDFIEYLLITTTVMAILSFAMKVLTTRLVRNIYPFFTLSCTAAGLVLLFQGYASFAVFLLLTAPAVFKLFLETSPEILEWKSWLMYVRAFSYLLLGAVLAPLLLTRQIVDSWIPLCLAAAVAVAVGARVWRSIAAREAPDAKFHQGLPPGTAAVLIAAAALLFPYSQWMVSLIVVFTVAVLTLPLPCVNLKTGLWDLYPPALRVVMLIGLILLINLQLAYIQFDLQIVEPLFLAISAVSAILWRQNKGS